jgi:seryl-tRNA synthetase
MINLKLLRENPEFVKKDLEKRYEHEKICLINHILEWDKIRRTLIQKVNKLRHERNLLTDEIARLKREGVDPSEKINEANSIPMQIKVLDKELETCRNKVDSYLSKLPNITHNTVPIGRDEKNNKLVRVWKDKPKFNFIPKDHIDLGTNLDIIDIERAAKVSGKRFTYLKREATLLEFALIRYVLDAIIDESFIPVIPPVLVKREAMYGGGFLPSGEDDIFWIKDKNLCLAGTSEVPLVAMHMNEILDEKKLPLNYAGFSTCFRTEAGSHGRDTKGIFRVHQFDKIELFKFTAPKTSWDEHEKLLETVEQLYRELDLHYRIINVCTGELGTTAAKKYDLELWLPGQGKYREVVSCSNCTDYQARRLNIRCRSGNEKPRIVHTLNSTAVAIGRVIIAILENYQQEDGSILIPDKLAQYLGSQKIALTSEK